MMKTSSPYLASEDETNDIHESMKYCIIRNAMYVPGRADYPILRNPVQLGMR